jgi:hypothetical protein
MFTENMPDGPVKDDFIKMMLKKFYKMENTPA